MGGQHQTTADQRLPQRELAGPRAGLAQQDPDLEQAEAVATVLLGDPEAEQPGLGQRGPVGLPLERLTGDGTHGVDLLGVLLGVVAVGGHGLSSVLVDLRGTGVVDPVGGMLAAPADETVTCST